MDREDIIRMAREAGVSIRAHYDETGSTPQELECFFQAAYAAGAAAEREACAKVCDDIRRMGGYSAETPDWERGTGHCADAIRARGNT